LNDYQSNLVSKIRHVSIDIDKVYYR